MAHVCRDNVQKRLDKIRLAPTFKNNPDSSFKIENDESAQNLFLATTPVSDTGDLDALFPLDEPKEETEACSFAIQLQQLEPAVTSDSRKNSCSAAISIGYIDSSRLSQSIGEKRLINTAKTSGDDSGSSSPAKIFKASPSNFASQVSCGNRVDRDSSQEKPISRMPPRLSPILSPYPNSEVSSSLQVPAQVDASALPGHPVIVESYSVKSRLRTDHLYGNYTQLNAVVKNSNSQSNIEGQSSIPQLPYSSIPKLAYRVFSLMVSLKAEVAKRATILQEEHRLVCPRRWGNCHCVNAKLFYFFKQNLWNDQLRKLVYAIVGTQLVLMGVQQSCVSKRDIAVKDFLKKELVPLWPKDWMTMNEIVWRCRKVFSMSQSELYRNFGIVSRTCSLSIGSSSDAPKICTSLEKQGTSTVGSTSKVHDPVEQRQMPIQTISESNLISDSNQLPIAEESTPSKKSRKSFDPKPSASEDVQSDLLSKSNCSIAALLVMLSEEIDRGTKKANEQKVKKTIFTRRKRNGIPVRQWSLESKKLLDIIMAKQLMLFDQDQSIKDKNGALEAFLQKSVIPLWPRGQVSVKELMTKSDDVFSFDLDDQLL